MKRKNERKKILTSPCTSRKKAKILRKYGNIMLRIKSKGLCRKNDAEVCFRFVASYSTVNGKLMLSGCSSSTELWQADIFTSEVGGGNDVTADLPASENKVAISAKAILAQLFSSVDDEETQNAERSLLFFSALTKGTMPQVVRNLRISE